MYLKGGIKLFLKKRDSMVYNKNKIKNKNSGVPVVVQWK